MLGYDVRRYQLVAFVIGSTLAGLSGVLYTAWGQYIVPAAMALPAAAMPIIWVAVGGRKDLTATLIGTLFVLWLFQTLIVISQQYALDRDRRASARHDPLHAWWLHRLGCREPRRDIQLAPAPGRALGGVESRRERWSVRMTVLLETTNLSKHFGGLKAVDDLSLAVRGGRAALPDRAERRRQEHILPSSSSAAIRRPPAPSASAARTSRSCTPPRASAAASASRSRCLVSLPSCRCGRTSTSRCSTRFAGPELTREIDRLLALVDLTAEAAQAGGAARAWPEAMARDRAWRSALRPKLLLLDEPTAGMSPEETYKTGEMIVELNRNGMTVLVVEHDMAFVRQIASAGDRAASRAAVRPGQHRRDHRTTRPSQEIYLGKGHHGH